MHVCVCKQNSKSVLLNSLACCLLPDAGHHFFNVKKKVHVNSKRGRKKNASNFNSNFLVVLSFIRVRVLSRQFDNVGNYTRPLS